MRGVKSVTYNFIPKDVVVIIKEFVMEKVSLVITVWNVKNLLQVKILNLLSQNIIVRMTQFANFAFNQNMKIIYVVL